MLNMTLSPDKFPVPLIRIKETDSTINHLQAICRRQAVEEFTTVIADFQTAGRGQRGNSWESEVGKNLLFSFVMYPDFLEARHQFHLSQIISLAIKEELDAYVTDISIKWPNDIYRGEKKICGMLIENDLAGKHISRSVAGIGINLNQETFRSPAPNPVSLRQITGKEYDILTVAGNVMARFIDHYSLLQKGETSLIAERYQEALFRKTGLHPYRDKDGEFSAHIIRVEPEGKLVLKDEGGRERGYLFKEVEYVFSEQGNGLAKNDCIKI